MRNQISITKTSHPKQWAVILAAFPNYRKRKALMIETESVSLHGRYWDDGSISKYVIVDPSGGMKLAPRRNDFPFTAPDPEIDLADGTQVVQCGVFCGKPGTAYLYFK
jgi:hypothetical protein